MSDVRWLKRNADLAGANAAIFDAVYGFAGCLPGIHEILRCQGIFEAVVCLESARKIVEEPGWRGRLRNPGLSVTG